MLINIQYVLLSKHTTKDRRIIMRLSYGREIKNHYFESMQVVGRLHRRILWRSWMHIRNRDCREIQRESLFVCVIVIVDMIIYYDTCLKNWMEIYMQQQYLNLWGMTVSKKEDVLYNILYNPWLGYLYDVLFWLPDA